MKERPVKTMFLDIGEVILNNGFDLESRKVAAKTFGIELEEVDERHRQTLPAMELGKITLDEYMNHVVFYKDRTFTRGQFRDFIFSRSKAYPQMIEMVCRLKAKYGLKIAVVSNETRELNAFRIRKFKLNRFVDVFISSCYVHLRKPDPDFFRLALDITQTPARQVVYIENTLMFVQIAAGLGIRGVFHTDYESTRAKLADLGLNID